MDVIIADHRITGAIGELYWRLRPTRSTTHENKTAGIGGIVGPGFGFCHSERIAKGRYAGETDAILANPGMGWETFHRTSKADSNLPPWIPSTVQYARWGWRDLEPEPGQIDYDFVDRAIRESREAGQKLAFRVMCCSPYKGRPYHPDWIEEVGGRILIADHKGVEPLPIPDMDDPAVLNRHLDFIKRLGQRYDGHAGLDHLDLGSIGWWGEWHLSGSKKCGLPTLENRMKVVDAYLDAFQKTPLVMLINGKQCAAYAIEQGTGWRADSMGDLGSFHANWNHMRNGYPVWMEEAKAFDAWKNGPIAYEPPAAVAEFVEKQWPLRWIFNYALACHGSLFSGKSGRLPQDDQFRQELKRFLQRLGYRLVLKRLEHPAEVQRGKELSLRMQWQNIGSAPCYKAYRLAYRLTGDRGAQQVLAGRVTVDKWLPGSIELFDDKFFEQPADLPPGDIADAQDAVRLPADLSPGSYVLSIAVVGQNDEKPVVQLGIRGRGDDGWYRLSKVEVVR